MRKPSQDDLRAIESLLLENGLPTDDLNTQDLSLFRMEGSSDKPYAVGGLERFGSHAIIRSIATTPSMRGRGIASKIVAELEKMSVEVGIETIYLLTESADIFFERKGYSPVERRDVPQSVRQSRQFLSLCPDSARVMRKRVGT
jgi:amino-acid N-acetyltransferase